LLVFKNLSLNVDEVGGGFKYSFLSLLLFFFIYPMPAYNLFDDYTVLLKRKK